MEMTDDQLKEFLGNLPVVFGLKAQGHIPTIERMLQENKDWKQIGEEIGWEPLTASLHYVWHLRAERDALKHDVEHAVAEAKRREPDYPWSQNTASECVWALGESLLGVSAAIGDWQEHVKKIEAERDAAIAARDAERERCAGKCDAKGRRLSDLASDCECEMQADFYKAKAICAYEMELDIRSGT